MDTGKIRDNYKFFEDFDGEPEIVIEAENTDMQILHICDGYFDDILREPNLDGNGGLASQEIIINARVRSGTNPKEV